MAGTLFTNDYKESIHTCQLPSRHEDNFPFAPVKPFTLKNIWLAWCGISKFTPKSDYYMESTASVNAERKRHANLKFWFIIHPFSFVRFLWNMFMIIVYIISFVSIPFMISFVVMDYQKIQMDLVNLPIYAIFWVDIFLNCLTGYYDKKTAYIELNITKMLKSYLKRFLLVDILSSLPYDHITLPWRRLPGNDPSAIVALINVLPYLKLLRYSTLNSNIFYVFTYFKVQNFNYELSATALLIIYIIFWITCIYYMLPILIMYVTNITTDECVDCWMMEIDDDSLISLFITAFYSVTDNLVAAGYGIFIPESNYMIVLNALVSFFGRLLACYFLILCTRMIVGSKASKASYEELMNQLQAYTVQKQLLPHMKKRLLAYYYYRFKNSYFRERRIMAELTEPLREETALHCCRRLIENVALFKDLPKDVLQMIVNNLKFELYLPNEVIVKAGAHGDCMFFLASGTVTVLTPTGKEICHLDDGAHFGEIALLVADQRRIASVIAIEVCEVYRLDRKDFRQCIEVNSELFAMIESIATERVERTVRIEEQHKRFLMMR